MSAPGPLATQPVGVAEGVRVVLLAVVALGWIALDDARISAVALGVAVLVSAALSLWARLRVTPLARPRSARGDVLAEVGVNEGPPRQVDYSADPKLDSVMHPGRDVPEVRERE